MGSPVSLTCKTDLPRKWQRATSLPKTPFDDVRLRHSASQSSFFLFPCSLRLVMLGFSPLSSPETVSAEKSSKYCYLHENTELVILPSGEESKKVSDKRTRSFDVANKQLTSSYCLSL